MLGIENRNLSLPNNHAERNLIEMSQPRIVLLQLLILFCVASAESLNAQDAKRRDADKAIRPFKIQVEDKVLTDLRERLARTRFPDHIEGSGWEYGIDLGYMKQLVAYWREKYDWRKQK